MPKLPKFLEVKEDDTEEEKKKKRFLLILFIVLIVLLLAGGIVGIVLGAKSCSGSNSSSESSTTSTTSETSSSESSSSESSSTVTDFLVYELNAGGDSYKVKGVKVGYPKDIVIPATHDGKPVTAIANYAFENRDIKSVDMADSVLSIGMCSFFNCSELESIHFSSNLQKTDNDAFYKCEKLTSVTIPSTLVDAAPDTFYKCTSLELLEHENGKYLGNTVDPYIFLISAANKDIASCQIASGCRFIASDAFMECSSLATIDIPSTVTKIGDSAFEKTGLTSVTIPSGVTYMGSDVFEDCGSLVTAIISDSVIEVGSSAFKNDVNLESVTLGKGLQGIRDALFDECHKLASLTIPSNIEFIDDFAFDGCDLLTALDYEGTMDDWNKIYFFEYWAEFSSLTVVHCTDGDVPVVLP